MACVPLTSLMNTIHNEFLQPRPPVILDEDTAHMVSSLYHNLCFLLAFLEELVKKAGIDEAAIKDLEAKIRDFAFLVEDEVESNLAKIYMEAADKDMTLFQNLQQVGEDAEMILFQKLRQVSEKTQNFVNRIKSQHYDSAIQNLPKVHTLPLDIGSNHKSGSSQRFSKIEDRMVGRTSELKTIREQLTLQPSEEGKAISILGMGGIGKSTLAKRVYDEPSVVDYFDLRAWTTVSQEVNMRQILCDLLWSIEKGMNTEESTDDLAHKLQQCLMGQRYLIVVDDIWETNVWDHLTRCFPKFHGSAVLVTSRLKEIADYTTSGASNLIHNLNFLDSNEYWDLFCSHIILKQPLHSKFTTIGRNIVGKCGGLPLAIVVAAGLVSQLSKVEELENIVEEMSYLASTDIDEQCSRILIVSYNHLPQHLKACFLYLGVFSEDSEIPVKKLVRLWIAEGFVKSVRDKELEEVGVRYLHDLISRSLVQIDKLKCD